MAGNKLMRRAVVVHTREMESFISDLSKLDKDYMAEVLVGAYAFQEAMLKAEGIDLLKPTSAIAVDSYLPGKLGIHILKLQKLEVSLKRNFEILGARVWQHTLRAAIHPDMRPLAQSMWTQLSRGFFCAPVLSVGVRVDGKFPEAFAPSRNTSR